MSRLDQFRQAFPQFKDASDSELIGQISHYAKMPYEEVATVLGVAAPSGASEVGRQFMGGLVVDAPKQFGQAAQYLQRERDVYADQVRAEAAAGEEPSWWQRGLQKMSPFYSVGLEAVKAQALSETPADQRTAPTPLERWGQETVAAAERRAPAYTPDTRGQGVVGDILSSGARGVGAAVPGLVTSVVAPPVGAAVMVSQYGGSSAEETYQKVKAAGGTDEDAMNAARMSGAVQGGLETATNLLTMGLAKPAKELGKGVMSALTKGGTVAATTKGVAKALTEPNVYREVGKAWLKSAAANTITEPIQDLATREIEAQYGVTPDASALDTAVESAKGGLGMSILLGPLFLGGGRARAKRAATLKSALYDKNVPPEIRAQAQDLVMSAAREKGVPEQDVDKWFEAQLEIEDARNAALQQLEGDKTAASDMDLQDEVLLERRINQLVAANTIGQLGLSDKKERNKKEQKKFEAKRTEDFNAAYNEPSGRFVTDAAGNERELTAGEALAMDAGLTLEQAAAQAVEDTKPANAAEQKTPLFTPQEKLYLEKVGPIKGAKGMAIFTEIENSELTEDQKLPLYTLLSQSKFEQARKNLGAMLYAKPTEVTADVSAPTATQPVAPRSLPDGGSDLLGGVGDTGLVPAGQTGVPAGDTGAGVGGGQVSPVPVRAAEPAANLTSTPVASLLTSPNAAQEAALLTPSAPGTFTPRAYVAPEADVTGQQTVAPSATPEVSLTAEDMGDIASMTGQGNLAAAAAEEERQAPATQDVNLDAVIAQRFSKGKNKERDAKILRAYITQLRADPAVDKAALQKAIADEFGVTPARVRQIGNPMEMTRAAEALGLDQQAVLDAMGVDSATKGEVDQIGKLQNEMASLRKQLKGATAEKRQEIADKMAAISEQVQKAKESAEQDRAAAYSTGLTGAGVESAAGQTAGFGFDEDRMWADLEGEDAATSELVNLSSQIGSLTEALADFEAQNNRSAVLQTRKMIADAQARVDELVQSVVQKAKAPKAKKVKEAPSAYEEEQNRIREEKAAAARAERAAELEKHRRGFNEGDRVSNAKLGEGTVVGFEDAKADTKIKIKFDSGETKTLSLQVAKLEKTRAVQKPSTAQVSVREGAGAGQEVGKGNAQKRQAAPAREAKGQTQEKILTDSEAAAQAWDKEARTYEGAPMFDELTAEQQQEFIDYGSDNWGPSDVMIMLAKIQQDKMRFGEEGTKTEKKRYTAKQLISELQKFIRADFSGRKLVVVDDVSELLTHPDEEIRAIGVALKIRNSKAFGVAQGGRAVLIANRIAVGNGRAAFMHEVGSHLGLDNLLTAEQHDKLTDQLFEWADRGDGSTESELALRAIARLDSANTADEAIRDELLAYFIEEAIYSGIDPIAADNLSGPLRQWFRTLWAAFKTAIRKLGVMPERLTAQDIVNMAYGAARLEIAGTWHGTAATFRKFNHKFMGKGEGAQAYGWGSYFAQRLGIAKGYFFADVKRKTVLKLSPSQSLQKYVDEGGWVLADDVQDITGEVLMAAGTELDLVDLSKLDELASEYGIDMIALSKGGKVDYVLIAEEGPRPDGMLARVDTSVPENEMLDWFLPITEQPKYVQDVVDKALQQVGAGPLSEWAHATGGDIYKAIEFQLGSHKKASELLDSLGVGGVKFLDQVSREKLADSKPRLVVNGKTYTKKDINAEYKAKSGIGYDYFALMGKILRNGLSAARAEYQKKYDEIVARTAKYYTHLPIDEATAKGVEDAKQSVYGRGLAWLDILGDNIKIERPNTPDRVDLPHNIVVFNDKNIFRVGGQARAERENMRFGVGEPGVIDRNVKKLPKALQDPVLNSIEALMDVKGKGLDLVVFTNTLVDRAVKAGIPAAEKLSRLINAGRTDARNLEREAEKIADMYADVPDEFRGTGDESVNRFLFDSTRAGKWGYGKYADKDMAARFDAFDEKTQEFIKAIFEHGDKMLALKKKTVLDATVSEYDAMIAKAKADGDNKTESKLLNEKKNVLKRYETLFRIREGKPYAPIKRDGNYFVVAKSQAYLVAEAADDKAKLKELEQSGDDYHVSFVDSKAEARTLRRQLEDQGAFESVEFAERDAAVDELFSNTTALRELTKIRAQVDQQAKDGDKSASKLLSVVNKMYLNALAEGSARQSEMRRRGVDGEVDMLHSFTRQARADAYFLSSLKTYPQVQQALQEMRSQARTGDRGRKSELKNELVRRYLQTLDSVDRPWINKMTRMSSLWYLATSPAYYLQNLTQPVIMSLPVMAGRHQYAKSSAALFKAYSELGGVISSGKLLKQQFDFDKVPADVREAIQELVNRGRIDIGMETEMGEFRVEGDGYVKEKWNKVDKALRLAVQKVESVNRLSTAIAAYRLELEKTGDAKQALDYADRILVDTHGDYSAFNAPRVFNTGAGKVVLQFRKFQLIQLAYYAKMINTADMNAVEKAAARKALGYSLAHTAAFAGLMGVPGYSAIAWALAALFGDDDDETPPTMQVRKYLVDSFGETTANMILRGAPTLVGMDISGKVGAGNIFSIMPFSKADLTTTAGRYQAIGELGGAAVGLGVRMADGVVLMAQGDWYKGLEQLLPKGVSDALKAYRFASEGVTRRNQDVVLPADEVSSLDTVWKSLGISPTKQSVMYEKADALKTMRDKLQSDAQQLQRDFLKAYKANDSAAIAEIRQEWFKLQGRRVKAGFARQPVTYLTRAPMEQRKRERNTMGGVQYQKSERRAVENLR